jgi:hypothetical protein
MSAENAHVTADANKGLRDEIIETQKSQAEILKWKLISVAAVATVSLGFGMPASPTGQESRILLCLIPFLCLYVDLISLHFMIRVLTIGVYLKLTGDPYEKFVFAMRAESATNPFVFETFALHGSSSLFNALLFLLGAGLYVRDLIEKKAGTEYFVTAYIVASLLGFVFSIILWLLYNHRQKEVIREAKGYFGSDAR